MATQAQEAPERSARGKLRFGWLLTATGLALPALGNALLPPRPAALSRGDVLHSALEGFTSTVTSTDQDIAVRLVMAPHAEGPPLHVHTTFDETFVVEDGTATLHLEGRALTLHPGERYKVPRNTPHAPHNETGEAVVLHTVLPRDFAGGLANFYRASDAIGDLESPRMLLALAAEGPGFDTFSPGAPIALQQALRWVLGPLGR
jgi:mannose-6-phosphate isomerase-like protein (cupin superfamily)